MVQTGLNEGKVQLSHGANVPIGHDALERSTDAGGQRVLTEDFCPEPVRTVWSLAG